MIKSFKHKGLKKFYETGSTAGVQAMHAPKLSMILGILEQVKRPEQITAPFLHLHELKGERKGDWSLTVQANWRVTFRFIESDVELVNYEDYH